MSQLPIDIDAEAVYFDGQWYTRDDMARRIKAMLDQGDFAITRPSQALEQLTQVISSVRTLAFRSTPDLVEAINAGAARAGKSVGAYIRDTLAQSLGLPSSDFGPMPRPAGEAAAANGRASTDPEVPKAGPGALRSSHNERLPSVVVDPAVGTEPVELKHPKKKEEESATERRWFNS
jgi:hypothetical protein